jgi:hypothetical protein
VLRKNSILIVLNILSPCRDNRQEQPLVPERETLGMIRCMGQFRLFLLLACTLLMLLGNALRFPCLCLRPSPTLAAENLFLCKQLSLYQERKATPKRATHATRLAMTMLSRWIDWRPVLAIVWPQTLIRWHRQGFRVENQSHRTLQQHTEAASVPSGTRNFVVLRETDQPHWCHTVFHLPL